MNKRPMIRKPSVGATRPFKKPRVSNMQKRIDAVGAAPQRINGPEFKNTDVSNAMTIPTATSSWSNLILLNGIDQGAGNSQRVGRRVTVKSILVRYNFGLPSPTATSQLAAVRLMIFYDKQPQGATPLITDVLDTASINSLTNLANSDRFVILRDWYLDNPKEFGYRPDLSGTFSVAGKEFIALPGNGLDEQFSGTGGTISSIATGAIYFGFVTTAATVNTSGSRIDFVSRVRYTDV